MQVLIRIFEASIALTVVALVVPAFLDLLGPDMLDFLSIGWANFEYWLGGKATGILISVFVGIFVVYFGRWIVSRTSNNGGQTPNNRGN